jgi:hypothetical protein
MDGVVCALTLGSRASVYVRSEIRYVRITAAIAALDQAARIAFVDDEADRLRVHAIEDFEAAFSVDYGGPVGPCQRRFDKEVTGHGGIISMKHEHLYYGATPHRK